MIKIPKGANKYIRINSSRASLTDPCLKACFVQPIFLKKFFSLSYTRLLLTFIHPSWGLWNLETKAPSEYSNNASSFRTCRTIQLNIFNLSNLEDTVDFFLNPRSLKSTVMNKTRVTRMGNSSHFGVKMKCEYNVIGRAPVHHKPSTYISQNIINYLATNLIKCL